MDTEVTQQTELTAQPLLFLGNHAALDLLNTAPIEGGVPVDRLVDYQALVTWLSRASLLSTAEAKKAIGQWGRTREGERALELALSLRHALHEVVEPIALGGAPSAAALLRLNLELRREVGAYTEIVCDDQVWATHRRIAMSQPEHVLAPLYEAVGKLFSEVDLALVRQCEDSECVLFFHDVTKNHARRWCSMETCGNRNKVSAYRARGRRA